VLRLILTYLSILICTSAIFGQLPSSEPTTVQFKVLTLDQALKLAMEEGKPLFIDSYAKWCIPCKKMDSVFKDREVAKVLNDNFINVKVNMDQPYGKDYQARYGVIFLPTFLFLDYLGNKQIKIDRVLTKYELIAYANTAVGKATFASTPPTSTQSRTTPKRSEMTTRSTTPSTRKSTNPHATRSTKSATTRSSTGATVKKSSVASVRKTQPTRRQQSTTQSTPPPTQSEEKILHVLKPEDMNPEILYQEAYMSMQLMDGSHWAFAEDYLKTQANWSSPKNMKFVFDFVRYTDTREFNYIIKNRNAFNELIGKKNVDRSIEIIVYTRINRGIPRPDLEEAINLYKLTRAKDPTGLAYKYYIKRLLDENKTDNLLPILSDYMMLAKDKDAKILNLFALYTAKETRKKDELYRAIEAVTDAIRINSSEHEYWKTLAILQTKVGNSDKAIRAARKSLELTPPSDKESIDYLNGLIRKNR